MNMHDPESPLASLPSPAAEPLVVALSGVDQRWLPLVGGKAAHLGELIRAGAPFAVWQQERRTNAAMSLMA